MSFHPQTPQSPSQYSPSTGDLYSSVNSSMTSTTTTLPTPAHSVNGSSIPSEMSHDVVMGEDTPHKRKRAVDDTGDREQKKVHIEDRKLGIENLHLDVGEKYLLCRTPHPQPRPQLTEDLFERYNLTGLAAEVARFLPNGERNALRKTYKGHIKKLGVQGRFDSVKEDPRRPTSLLSLMKVPNQEWDVLFVRGQSVTEGFNAETKQLLLRATTMSKGVVPKSVWDSSVLGELGPGKPEKQTPSARPTAPNTPLATAAALQRAKTTTPTADALRPKRDIKKRSYGDNSFEGYGEGYPDDGSEYEGNGNGPKRRKKTHAVTQSFAQGRPSAYSPGITGQ